MGRRSKRSAIAHGILRKEGLFTRFTDPSYYADCSLDAEPDDDASWSFMSDWWSGESEEARRHNIVGIPSTKRRKVYLLDSERTKRRAKSNLTQPLKACPMAPINTFFISTQAKSSTLAETSCMVELQELYAKSKQLNGPGFIQIVVLLKFFDFTNFGPQPKSC